jgi:hypothetical protein
MIRYRLECNLRLKRQNQKTPPEGGGVYIREGSMPLLRSIVAETPSPFPTRSPVRSTMVEALVSGARSVIQNSKVVSQRANRPNLEPS